MFRDAVEKACDFTCAMAAFWLKVNGEIGGSPASFVVVNEAGWIVTAAHVLSGAMNLVHADSMARAWEKKRDAITNDLTLNSKERNRQLQALGKLDRKSVRRAYALWNFIGSNVVDVAILPAIDLAVGRLEPFDPMWVKEYPIFKDPNKDFRVGASLCKLGFPFQEVKPTYNEAKNSFEMPQGINLAFFPIEGMFTRTLNVPPPDPAPPFPLRFVETSTPGLVGQSGGPTFDAEGAIWAIQSRTQHLALGFSPEMKEAGQTRKEHQFLNVGMGIHVETILGFFNQLGIQHKLSKH